MAAMERRSVSLPPDLARYVDHLVETGVYGSRGEVLLAGLRAMRARDAAMERWVLNEVVPMLGALHGGKPWDMPEEPVLVAVRQQQAIWLGEDGPETSRVYEARGKRNT